MPSEPKSERASEKRFVSSTPSAESKQGAMNFPASQTKWKVNKLGEQCAKRVERGGRGLGVNGSLAVIWICNEYECSAKMLSRLWVCAGCVQCVCVCVRECECLLFRANAKVTFYPRPNRGITWLDCLHSRHRTSADMEYAINNRCLTY